MICSIIAAVSNNNVIGNKGRIPWDLPEDRLHFKNITMNHAVVFGRKSFEEIGKPLPGRLNIVVSSTKNFEGQNLHTVKSLQEVFELIKGLSPLSKGLSPLPSNLPTLDTTEIFICGGQRLYQEAINIADKIYLTKINADIEGDTFFPEIRKDRFIIVRKSPVQKQNGLEYQFIDLKKK